MPLDSLAIEASRDAIPDDVAGFLEVANQRIEDFIEERRNRPVPGFVPSDFDRVYLTLRGLIASRQARGESFLEWGSGFGVVTGLAAFLELDAAGIEIERDLVEAGEELIAEYELPAIFACGSFIPPGGEHYADLTEGPEWLGTAGMNAYEELDADLEDFDVVFAYPWPGEEGVIEALFEDYADYGALLVTYRGFEDLCIQRKVKGEGRRLERRFRR